MASLPFRPVILLLAIATASSLSSSAVAHTAGFTVSGTQLRDANGAPFYARGINNPDAWFDKQAYDALAGIAARKTNCVRIVWQRSGDASRLDQICTRCEELHMVPIVELHDGTGKDDPEDLIKNAEYFTRPDVLAVILKHQKDLLVNIANEWSDGSKPAADWRDAYKAPITILRQAGITTTLIVDAPGFGQNYRAVIARDSGQSKTYGQRLLDFDPRHNLLFSVHMYAKFNERQEVTNAMATFSAARLPLIIGEFGYDSRNGHNNLGCKVDDRLVMKCASHFHDGYAAWSTQGNDISDAWLDLMTGWSKLTWWGNEVFNATPDSITNSARPASVFARR